ncbi:MULTISPECIES: FADH(2)-oxidizing methylenetetrahydrofolate--tRNA-(uracil(54)-C(5))-methyltransferase TrmFO [Bacillales]|jgi:methylenetetrahydrofolate--tRNA-(uracil-5-)-methyltransferase|uniref:Methylenetetrahydrofolate--tRNA-(uracil-5-)-methyltransferase TrmFO n=1 Tax=Brevibacillus aydinogluensis TaxID=927786 RepID=A0AA48M709_9BACL|nr:MULTISPECIES: FADH(2)-oxidizing methylenetetrahydrofolate--tRNA-(uracil(54)-C(5))-methyltransferase TrmFO [Bacillales]REK64223.1 MAG: methylenetetrahydrofolate--tRNA-(uracil(54)-C(5))-methyltransferase (FADH(2)-oxidizing) TrmFO [Brevibacillus sp.]MBR8659505.1 FADH(2)-oxidizing methylenetetrahydrofolate--tRNA-(uracil(54)-C(5))-methyltransferase TrmFO [Brevibacillus sp. NL20B1]MDT3415035.1 methylenetetrahydrofolate--tRNA-(uracil-5-)-methyltransferase [Brevibacillus aydinogluensis]NNV01792.1 FA
MNEQPYVTVVGAGLAGSEAAWQIAQSGVRVKLYEMRPKTQTPAHHTDKFAELVCSNSLRANSLTNAVGVLKEEMRRFDSVIIGAADKCAVPAGGALAVDRHEFAQYVTDAVRNHPLIEVINEEVTEIPEGIVVIATGPLTSPALSEKLKELTGEEYLYFYDAAAPIIEKDSIDMDKVFVASRYDKGEAAYLNCPMTEEEFNRFYDALITAEEAPLKEFEKEIYFEGCMPIEVMAKRGRQTMLFGPLKPVGLIDPRTGKQPFAVVQLRQDNGAATLYNMVGFQTHLKWPEQKRVFSLIPGLENCEIVRYGVMHRNTFINSPRLLRPTYQYKGRDTLFFAGQMTGVEGYVESAASGLLAGINAARLAKGEELLVLPPETVIGSMARYITTADPNNFQPMNANFGLVPELPKRIRNKREKNEKLAERALDTIQNFTQKRHKLS